MSDAPPFSPVASARHVLRLAATASLGTLDDDGAPFTSLVTVATTAAGEPILLLSDLALHTRNLKRDKRASLLLVAPGGEGGDPLAGARLTLTGTLARDDDPALRRRFLARHEEAAGYAGFADFGFYRLTVEGRAPRRRLRPHRRAHALPTSSPISPAATISSPPKRAPSPT